MLALTLLTVSADASCGIVQYNDTLGYLDPASVTKVAALSPSACCAQCVATPACASWSFSGAMWTPTTPCHMSPLDFVGKEQTKVHSGLACGSARAAPPAPAAEPGTFIIDTTPSGRRQVFEGVEVELQSDSIGTNNKGMPMDGKLVPDADPSAIGAPHDLTPSERARFATEIVMGVRTVRLALGLFLRGSPDNKSIVGRWPSQMAELRALQDASGIEGWAPEYWSPPPGWKSARSYYGGTLASFSPAFLLSFADSIVRDVAYLQAKGLRVTWWGLQNEPNFGAESNVTCPPANESQRRAFVRFPAGGAVARSSSPYAQCQYTQCSYYHAFMACAKKIRAHDASIRIHANSYSGQLGAAPVALDPEGIALVDAFTQHTVNCPSAKTFGNVTRTWSFGKPAFTNEMEYQPGSRLAGSEEGTVAAVNTFLNTLTFKDAPTGVIILHAIKPTTNIESLGYGWAWWRPTGSNASSAFPALRVQHWTPNYWNWNSVAPFTKTVPWNSWRLNVMEDRQRVHQRVVAFETPGAEVEKGPLHARTAAGKLIVVLTNEQFSPSPPSTFNVTVGTSDGNPRVWRGYSFKGDAAGAYFNISLGTTNGAVSSFVASLPANTVQWWYEV